MVDEIKSLIINQLKVVFPHVSKVYDEPVQQGLKTPAFLVLLINNHQERKLNRNMVREYTFNIVYFPSNEREFNAECDSVNETFNTNFRYLANRFHVFNVDGIKQDRTLILTFSIKASLVEVIEEFNMQKLEVRQFVKEK